MRPMHAELSWFVQLWKITKRCPRRNSLIFEFVARRACKKPLHVRLRVYYLGATPRTEPACYTSRCASCSLLSSVSLEPAFTSEILRSNSRKRFFPTVFVLAGALKRCDRLGRMCSRARLE